MKDKDATRAEIGRYPWSHICDLSFEVAPLDSTEVKREVRKFINRVNGMGSPVWWLSAIERSPSSGRLHAHILIGGTERLRPEKIGKQWRRSKTHKVKPVTEWGGIYYVADKTLDDNAEWDIDGNIDAKVAMWRSQQ